MDYERSRAEKENRTKCTQILSERGSLLVWSSAFLESVPVWKWWSCHSSLILRSTSWFRYLHDRIATWENIRSVSIHLPVISSRQFWRIFNVINRHGPFSFDQTGTILNWFDDRFKCFTCGMIYRREDERDDDGNSLRRTSSIFEQSCNRLWLKSKTSSMGRYL